MTHREVINRLKEAAEDLDAAKRAVQGLRDRALVERALRRVGEPTREFEGTTAIVEDHEAHLAELEREVAELEVAEKLILVRDANCNSVLPAEAMDAEAEAKWRSFPDFATWQEYYDTHPHLRRDLYREEKTAFAEFERLLRAAVDAKNFHLKMVNRRNGLVAAIPAGSRVIVASEDWKAANIASTPQPAPKPAAPEPVAEPTPQPAAKTTASEPFAEPAAEPIAEPEETAA